MAKYEKRSVKKVKIEKPKAKTNTKSIKMRPEKSVKLPREKKVVRKQAAKENKNKRRATRFVVIKGYKDINRKKTLGYLAAVLCVVGIIVLVTSLTPTGIGEYISNSFAAMENGSGFPQKLTGDDVLNAETEGEITYILSKTFLETYNSSGYNLINDQHGFSNSVLKTSAARALVFDRGGVGCKVYNYKRCIEEKSFEDKIMSGYIGRDGSMAFVFNSEEYASRIEVYNKDFVRQYSWNAASETISAVVVSDNGSKAAVATLKSVNGEFVSFIYIFDFKSATPIFTKQISGDVIISLYSDSKSIWAVCTNGVYRISWSDNTSTDINSLGEISIVHHNLKKMVIATPSPNNTLDTSISVYDQKGNQVTNVVVTGEADDVFLGKNCVYVLISDSVEAYDFEGNFILKTKVGYDVKCLAEISSKNFAAISTNNIVSYKVK